MTFWKNFCLETKVHTFLVKDLKGVFLGFYEKEVFFDVKIMENVLILRKKTWKVIAFFLGKELCFLKRDFLILLKTMIFLHFLG